MKETKVQAHLNLITKDSNFVLFILVNWISNLQTEPLKQVEIENTPESNQAA